MSNVKVEKCSKKSSVKSKKQKTSKTHSPESTLFCDDQTATPTNQSPWSSSSTLNAPISTSLKSSASASSTFSHSNLKTLQSKIKNGVKRPSNAKQNIKQNSISDSSTDLMTNSSLMSADGSKMLHVRKDSRSNDRFHQLFPSVPIYETVIDTYACAFVKSLNLFQGVMYLTNNYICFYSKILSHETILIFQWSSIDAIEKTYHALIFPTAIRIKTKNSTYVFTSFLTRGHTYDHLVNLWMVSRERQNMLRSQTYPHIKQEDLYHHQKDESTKLKLVMPPCQEEELVDGSNAYVDTEEVNNNDLAKSNRNLRAQATQKEPLNTRSHDDSNTNKPNTLADDDSLNKPFCVIKPSMTNTDLCSSQFNHMHKQNLPHSYSFSTNPHTDKYDFNKLISYEVNFNESNKVTVNIRHKKTLIQIYHESTPCFQYAS